MTTPGPGCGGWRSTWPPRRFGDGAREARALARLAARRTPPAELVLGNEAFWEAVRQLPKRQAQCVALHYLEDRPIAEIATVLDIAEATVRSYLHHGRTALAISLDVHLDEEQP